MRVPKNKWRLPEELAAAIGDGDLERVKTLLAAGADPNFIEEAGDVTFLMLAAEKGDLDIVRALVAAGADVNAIGEDLSGDLDAFPFLDDIYARGALVGVFPLAYAALYGHDGVYDFLRPLTSPRLREQADALRRTREEFEAHSPKRAWPKRAGTKKAAEADALLKANPKLARWVQQCVLCSRRGYKPDMPETIDRTGSADVLRRYFKPLALKDYMCDTCRERGARAMKAAEERRNARPARRSPGSEG